MFRSIKRWYAGEDKFHEFENDPSSGAHIFPLLYTEIHWTAKFVRIIVKFYLRNWQWLWGTTITIAGLYIAILTLGQNFKLIETK